MQGSSQHYGLFPPSLLLAGEARRPSLSPTRPCRGRGDDDDEEDDASGGGARDRGQVLGSHRFKGRPQGVVCRLHPINVYLSLLQTVWRARGRSRCRLRVDERITQLCASTSRQLSAFQAFGNRCA
jgi:hypothetical protein